MCVNVFRCVETITHASIFMWGNRVDVWDQPQLLLDFVHWIRNSQLDSELRDEANLSSQLALGSPDFALCIENFSWTGIHTIIYLGAGESNSWSHTWACKVPQSLRHLPNPAFSARSMKHISKMLNDPFCELDFLLYLLSVYRLPILYNVYTRHAFYLKTTTTVKQK